MVIFPSAPIQPFDGVRATARPLSFHTPRDCFTRGVDMRTGLRLTATVDCVRADVTPFARGERTVPADSSGPLFEKYCDGQNEISPAWVPWGPSVEATMTTEPEALELEPA